MLESTAVALGLLAVALALPVPWALARASWPDRDPLVALVCWQAIGLAGGLSIIGALLVHGLTPWAASLPEALWRIAVDHTAGPRAPVRGDHWVALTLAVVLAAELLGVLVVRWVRTARTRRRHRTRLEVLVRPLGRVGVDARVLDSPQPAAFCIPGRRPLLVVSAGLLDQLSDAEVEAVVAHERAHLSEHHHLLVLPFVAWQAALPVLPAADLALGAVRGLVELRADDVALRLLGDDGGARRVLARALVATAAAPEAPVPGEALAATGANVVRRVRRLLDPPAPLSATARLGALTAAGLLLLVPTLLLVLPALT